LRFSEKGRESSKIKGLRAIFIAIFHFSTTAQIPRISIERRGENGELIITLFSIFSAVARRRINEYGNLSVIFFVERL